jgi:hypothetical protein
MISVDSILQKVGVRRQHQCNDLVDYTEVFQMLQQAEWQDIGLQNVPLERVVGSAGRSQDFDLTFTPRRDTNNGRLTRIVQVRAQGAALPPPLLYKVADAYFVEDGNHRIAVARKNGDLTIDARVIEIDPSGLIFEPACTRLGFKLKGHGEGCQGCQA